MAKFSLGTQYLLISALQKSVRWCEVNASRYFARELVDMGTPGAALNRLLLIAAEDVGLADPTLLMYERNCLDRFDDSVKQHGIKKKDAARFPDLCEIVDEAAIAAALSYKSRMLAFASFATLFDIYENENFKQSLQKYQSLFAKAVENRDEKQALYYAYVAGLFMDSMDRIVIFIKNQGEERKHNLVLDWVAEYKRKKELLVLTGSIIMLCRYLNFAHGEFSAGVAKYLGTPITKATIPDRAYDKHTTQGKKRGRGLKHFFNEGATVKNERFLDNWKDAGEAACYSAEKKKVLGTDNIIEAIKAKYEKSQRSTRNSEPLTF